MLAFRICKLFDTKKLDGIFSLQLIHAHILSNPKGRLKPFCNVEDKQLLARTFCEDQQSPGILDVSGRSRV